MGGLQQRENGDFVFGICDTLDTPVHWQGDEKLEAFNNQQIYFILHFFITSVKQIEIPKVTNILNR